MKTIYVSGTAGAGKSLLTARLHEHYTANGAFAAVLNLDPGVLNLPYTCDVDVRDYVDIVSIMEQYDLGPNGALIMASDLVATKIDDVRIDIERVNPDYLIVDTPGQIELFAYRSSAKFLIDNLTVEDKTNVFIFDGSLITTPTNFVSIALLATSIRLRLGLPTINTITKTDLIGDQIETILRWSTSLVDLENEIAATTDGDMYTLVTNILRGINLGGFVQGVIPISNVSGDGFVSLEAALSRILNLGEDVED